MINGIHYKDNHNLIGKRIIIKKNQSHDLNLFSNKANSNLANKYTDCFKNVKIANKNIEEKQA